MTGTSILLALLALPQGEKQPPPLTEAQRTRIAKLANDTQKETARLRALLEARQKELAAVYGEYELDEKRAARLEAEIIDLQKKMLAAYRKMQIELRTLIGKERFVILKRRLDNMLRSPPAEKDKKR
jgi:hypothetical protein